VIDVASVPLFAHRRETYACPGEFCEVRCTAETCSCKPCWCDPCKRRRVLARRPMSRPRVRYTPPAPVQAPLFKEPIR